MIRDAAITTLRALFPLYAVVLMVCFMKWAVATHSSGDGTTELILWVGVAPLAVALVMAAPLFVKHYAAHWRARRNPPRRG